MSDMNINLGTVQPSVLYNTLLQAGYTIQNGSLVPPSNSRGGFYGTVPIQQLQALLDQYGIPVGQPISFAQYGPQLFGFGAGSTTGGQTGVGQPNLNDPGTTGPTPPTGTGQANFQYYAPPLYTMEDITRSGDQLPNQYTQYDPYGELPPAYNPYANYTPPLGGFAPYVPPFRGGDDTIIPGGGDDTPPGGGDDDTPPSGGDDTPPGGNGQTVGTKLCPDGKTFVFEGEPCPVPPTPPVLIAETPVPRTLPPVPVEPPRTTCPAPWTAVRLADGTDIEAGNLVVGMEVRTQHENTLEWGDYAVEHVEIIPDSDRCMVRLEDAEIVCSLTHKFYCEGDWVEAQDVEPGMIFSGQKVLALEPYPSGEVVLITVSDAHTYLTEGILSHNKSPIVTPPPPPVPPSSGGTTPGGTTPGGTTPGGNQIPMGDGSYRPGVDDTVLTGGTPSGGIATLVGRGGGGEGGVRPPSMASRPAEIQAMISNLARDQRIRDMRALTELPSSMSFAEGGAVMEDDDIPPEIRDRQRAVTQMLANRASMLQSAQSQSMPSPQLPQQGMVPPVAPSMPMPANAPVGMMPPGQPLMPQVPQGPVSFGIPQQQGMGPQPSPMQAGIMGAPQLRGGF